MTTSEAPAASPPSLRVLIGGWTAGAVRPADVAARLRVPGVGEVRDVYVKGDHAFATLVVALPAAEIMSSLRATYAKTVWRGGRLRIEEASPDYLARLRSEWELMKASEPEPTAPCGPLKVLRIRKKRGNRTMSVPARSVYEYVPGVTVHADASCCVGEDAGPNTMPPRQKADKSDQRSRLPVLKRAKVTSDSSSSGVKDGPPTQVCRSSSSQAKLALDSISAACESDRAVFAAKPSPLVLSELPAVSQPTTAPFPRAIVSGSSASQDRTSHDVRATQKPVRPKPSKAKKQPGDAPAEVPEQTIDQETSASASGPKPPRPVKKTLKADVKAKKKPAALPPVRNDVPLASEGLLRARMQLFQA